MNADKDRENKKLLWPGLELSDGDHKRHEETGVFTSQYLRLSAFMRGSLLHGCG
jgi:hypothetical protein